MALVIGAIIFVGVLSSTLRDASARAGETRAEELAARIDAQGLEAIRNLDDDEVVLLLDADGEVVAASSDAEGLSIPSSTEPLTVVVDGDPMLLVPEDLDDDRILMVGVPTDDDQETVGTVITLLVVAVPVLVLLVGVTTWLMIGRALAPVARIRSEVDDITADRLDRRIPVPESRDEIAALATTMNGMLGRLDVAAQAQRRFISDASHELRSPLATIRQHVELSQAHPDLTSVEELSSVVHEEGLRLQGLVDALLVLAKLDEGAGGAQVTVDLDDCALAEAARLRTLGFTVDASGVGPARMQGDARLVGQLVRNLADNAARHARGRIAIAVLERNGAAVLTIEEDGDGVPVDERTRIFERFVRLDEARSRDAGGSGLGLAIVHGIARSAGGSVAVDDGRWGGARFTVTFPASS
ncbi:sensor histidine kinase [Microbacterium pygmaeum]|uniref:sensor histidine kinase n=1 Tax=Microbacterium pygmaeum TaxID=370764 RepID=UPI001E2EE89F|nr:HAMP domain-containing sensor histidine kinase [Microbacterium pygmaeum]